MGFNLKKFVPLILVLVSFFVLVISASSVLQRDNFEERKRDHIQFINSGRLGRRSEKAQSTTPPQSNSPLSLDMRIGPAPQNYGKNDSVTYIRVSNRGETDEVIEMTVFDNQGHQMPLIPSKFSLGRGASAEIPLKLPPRPAPVITGRNSEDEPMASSSTNNVNMITVLARGKREEIKRSFVFGDPYDNVNYPPQGPFCYEKDVTGTCRYRDDPSDCFRFHWTAYATILNNYAGQKITSLPEGLFVDQGDHGRVRVYLKVSCCIPIVQFIATDLHHHVGVNSCIVDVRDLQNLHPGEIVGIVLGCLFLLIVIIVLIIICARRRRRETIAGAVASNSNKNSRRMLPRIEIGSSSSRSRSKETEVISARK